MKTKLRLMAVSGTVFAAITLGGCANHDDTVRSEAPDPALVAQSVAQALGLRDAGGGTHGERLISHLRERCVLLVLDNFEHLLGAAPFVAELLATCHGVAVLATSRAPLGIGGEHELPVPVPSHDEVKVRLDLGLPIPHEVDVCRA